MSEKAKKINIFVDLFLLLLFLGGCIYFIIETIMGELIPMKYIQIVGIILSIIFILLLLSFFIQNLGMFIIRKILLIILCGVLAIGAIFQSQIRSAFEHVDDASESIRRMYVLVLKESEYETLDDLSNYGYVNILDNQDETSNRLITHAINEIESYELEGYPYESINLSLQALDNQEIDAFLISDVNHDFYANNDESDYSKKYRILDTIKMTIENDNLQVDSDLTEPFVVYISGMDDIGMPNYNGRSDVNMLAFVDPANNHVELVSINRDTYVLNENLYDYPDKLTHLGWYGPEASARALERCFDIEIDYTVRVTFESVIKIIDALGGIDVDVKISFTEQNEFRSFASDDLIRLEKGYQHLNGSQALAYARHRKSINWGVEGREQAQRDIVEAVVKKILSVEGALKVGDMLEVAASYVSTNLPMSSAKAFVMNAIDEGSSWTFGSSTVDSHYEYLLPCAMVSTDAYAVLLTYKDIQGVHDLYVSMKNQQTMNEFEFDLLNMEQYKDEIEIEDRIVTFENYYSTINKYFPNYLRTIY